MVARYPARSLGSSCNVSPLGHLFGRARFFSALYSFTTTPNNINYTIMSFRTKWEAETTIRFIQLYKQCPCLWNFQSPEYKLKRKRDAAYKYIGKQMNIPGFGIQDVKNKIKNLRSTYNQEKNKMLESTKPGAGCVYISNLKWLKEMEDVFPNDSNIFNETNLNLTDEEICSEDNSSAPFSHFTNNVKQEVPLMTFDNHEILDTVNTTPSNTGNTARAKKRSREIQTISDLKKLNASVDLQKETIFDVFGKSVALQLKNLSAENALLAQNRIQNILTEYGILELRQQTGTQSSNHDYQRRSVDSDASNVSFRNDHCFKFEEC